MKSKSTPTIGLVINSATGIMDPQFAGVADKAQELGVDLICFAGNILRPASVPNPLANGVFELAGPENVDGLIIWSGGMNWYVGNDVMAAFCERYRPLPLVSVEVAFDGIPSLLMDDYQGMYLAIQHLIEVHDRRRIAFIRGPEGHLGARERYHAYVKALDDHGIPLDASLVVQGSFLTSSGVDAMRVLLEKRYVKFNALASVNDSMAIGAMQVLEYHGLHVPEDVAIVNFDNSLKSGAIATPLTVVDPPFYALGQRAVETLLAQIEGKTVPACEHISPTLVVRRSCGCILQTLEKAVVPETAIQAVIQPKPELEWLAEQRDVAIEAMKQSLSSVPAKLGSEWAKDLWDAFLADVSKSQEGVFIAVLQKQLKRVVESKGDFYAWQDVLSALRLRIRPVLDGNSPVLLRAENLWQQGRILIVEAALQLRSYQQLHTQSQTDNSFAVIQAIIATFDMESLKEAITRELPKLNIQNCYISLCQEPGAPEKGARLILAYDETGPKELPPEGRTFKSKQLAPSDILSETRHQTFMLMSLYFDTEPLGFMLIGVGSRISFNLDVLRAQIAIALRGARLLQTVQKAEKK